MTTHFAALSDVYAMNGEAVSALALCVLPFGPEHKVEQTLIHMLAGVCLMRYCDDCLFVVHFCIHFEFLFVETCFQIMF